MLVRFPENSGDKADAFMTGGGKLSTWVAALSVVWIWGRDNTTVLGTPKRGNGDLRKLRVCGIIRAI